ncbi:HEXXH motif-containing putative peptide modification protein [Hamadaea sp. NPDC051192]|uniref:aKG-HExxH-type peptide beta-hydroxylase n=1 Tax=Hamadaea sp. NPDC051192 TaxID=3154940 RepID=UPI00344A464A
MAELHARTHILGRSEFDQLASGLAAPRVVEALCRSRVSRSLLLLRRVAAGAGRPDALHLLSQAHDRDRESVNDLMVQPSVAGWLAACVRGPSLAGQHRLAPLALAAAVRAGLAQARVEVSPVHSAVMVPTFGLLAADEPRTIAPQDLAGPSWYPIRVVRAGSGSRRIAVPVDDLDPFRGYPGAALSPRLSDDEYERLQSHFVQAWSMLCRHSPGRADELACGLLTLVPLTTEGMLQSATYADAFGAVMTTLPRSGLELVEVLVHEVAHSKLAAAHALTPLVVAGYDGAYTAPWIAGPRPLDRLLQGIFAFASVSLAWRDLRADAAVRRHATEQMTMRAEQVSQALRQVIDDPSGLTVHGWRLVQRLESTMAGVLGSRQSNAA